LRPFALKKQISPSSMLSVSVIIDDTEIFGVDLQQANNGDMKKMTTALIPQIPNEHFTVLCTE